MISEGDFVYDIKNDVIDQVHIKYKTKISQHTKKYLTRLFTSRKYIIQVHNYNITIYKLQTLDQVYEILRILFKPSIVIFDNFLILRHERGNQVDNLIVYDLSDNIVSLYDVNQFYCDLLKFPDRILLLIGGFIFDNDDIYECSLYYICRSIEHCIGVLRNASRYQIMNIEKPANYYFPKNNNEIIGILFHKLRIQNIIMYDINFQFKYQIEVNIIIDFNKQRIVIINNVIYIWDFHIVLIIDTKVLSIANVHKIIAYNHKYNVFINKFYKLYKIIDGNIMPFWIQLNFWNDIDKPTKVDNILSTLIECYILPEDIINEIYKQIMINHYSDTGLEI